MKKLIHLVYLTALAVLFWQCSENDEQASNLNGTASKGIVANANVTVYAYAETGARGEVLATTTTDASGNFNVSVDHKGYVEVVVSGGSYVDEAAGEEVEVDELKTIIAVDGDARFGVTALTTIAAAYVNENAEQGLEIAIASANKGVAEAFGIADVDIASTIAADLSTQGSSSFSTQQKKYGAVQAGICQLIHEKGLSAEAVLDLISEMAVDYKDGKFDGKSGGATITFSMQITSEQALVGLELAIEAFLSSDNNRSGYSN